MSKFTFSKSSSTTTQSPVAIKDGVHVAVIVQVAHIGLQLAFDREKAPEEQLAVAFELASGDTVTKRMKFSDHPHSGCFALFNAAFADPSETDNPEPGLADLLGKPVLIEIEVRDGKWPRVTEVLALEDGFEPIEPKSELLEFDADEMDSEVYKKLHRDIRALVSKRVRSS
jgi:hypothetical protein